MKISKIGNKIRGKRKKGFTLIEIIVAVTIIIILSALAVPKVSGYIAKAKEAKATSAGKQIFTAAMWSYTDNNEKFDVDKVKASIENTSNVKLATTKPAELGGNDKSVNIYFTIDNKTFVSKVNGDSNSYTIEDTSVSPAAQIFDSSK